MPGPLEELYEYVRWNQHHLLPLVQRSIETDSASEKHAQDGWAEAKRQAEEVASLRKELRALNLEVDAKAEALLRAVNACLHQAVIDGLSPSDIRVPMSPLIGRLYGIRDVVRTPRGAPRNPGTPRWEFKTEGWHTEALDKLLADGWEPFAFEGTLVALRRLGESAS